EEFRVKTVLFWLAGGLEGRGWVHLRIAGIVIAAGCAALLAASRILDVLSLGDEEAAALGMPVHPSRLMLLLLAALVAGAATAAAGSVPRGESLVVRNVTFALEPGEAVALVGPNAAGKSTLVRALAGLLPAASGEVRLQGRPLGERGRDAVARAVALVSTDEGPPAALTVEERARLGRFPHRGALRPFTAADQAAVTRALERTGIQ